MHDIWRSGYVRRSLAETAHGAALHADDVVWLPEAGPFRYLADPFGIQRGGLLTVFVEAYDHRTRRGDIRFFQYDDRDVLVRHGPALCEPWHLSYPQIIEDAGALYMLPEGHKSGALTLYRCDRFPDRWTPVARLLDQPAIDATVVRHGDGWWMFYALPGPDDRAMRELHVAFAPSLTGPWTPHPSNPVMTGFRGCRPGGTALSAGDAVLLPVQDCRGGYGLAIDWLRITLLTTTEFAATPFTRNEPGELLAGHGDGLHTLSGDASVTCLDVKGLRRSPWEGAVGAEYKLRRLFGLGTGRRRRSDIRLPASRLALVRSVRA